MGEGREEGGRKETTSSGGFGVFFSRYFFSSTSFGENEKNEKNGISLWDPANDFQAVSPSSFLRFFVSRRALTG